MTLYVVYVRDQETTTEIWDTYRSKRQAQEVANALMIDGEDTKTEAWYEEEYVDDQEYYCN